MAVRIDRYQGFGFALAAYYDIFFSEDDVDEESELEVAANERKRIVKIEGYAERVIPSMSDPTFKTHFRLARPTFASLLNQLAPLLTNRIRTVGKLKKNLLFATIQ
jgi:hypothetical protein